MVAVVVLKGAIAWAVLVGGGVGLAGACVTLAGIDNLAEAPRAFLTAFGVAFTCYAAALGALRGLRGPSALLVVLVVAVVCRMVLLVAPPTLSTDAYRYVWDAKVASAGFSPYVMAPSAPELAPLRDATIYPRLNHPTWRTIYPPGAQLVFRAVYALAPDSVVAMKATIGLGEIAAMIVLASLLGALGVPLVNLAIYAWNPLVLVETWGTGHLDALAILFVVGAVRLAVARRLNLAAALLGLGTLVKLYPAALLLLLLEGTALMPFAVFALAVMLGYLPYAHLGLDALGSLRQYVESEFFNPGLVRTLIEAPAVVLLALAAWVVYASTTGRERPLTARAILVVAGVVVLSPNVFPWYVLWLVPLLAVEPSIPWIAFTGSVALAYTFFLFDPWAIPAWARLAEALPLLLGGLWAVGRRWSANRTTVSACLTARPGGQA
jgi:alpha-1,6-mannosyltransferase